MSYPPSPSPPSPAFVTSTLPPISPKSPSRPLSTPRPGSSSSTLILAASSADHYSSPSTLNRGSSYYDNDSDGNSYADLGEPSRRYHDDEETLNGNNSLRGFGRSDSRPKLGDHRSSSRLTGSYFSEKDVSGITAGGVASSESSSPILLQSGTMGATGATTGVPEGERLLKKHRRGLEYENGSETSKSRSGMRRRTVIILCIVGLLIALAIVVGTVVGVHNRNQLQSAVANDAARSSSVAASTTTLPTATSSSTTPSSSPTAVVNESKNQPRGSDGSIVYLDDGTSFVYNNSFGGHCSAIPFDDSAQAQSDVPPLNQSWDYNVNRIHGVNLGGWLVLEPFITPELFEPFNPNGSPHGSNPTVIDEYSLSVALGSNLTTVIEGHYKTFIIAGAGLNWVRLPVPYWLIETYPGEPFLASVGWQYFLLGLSWARKYGIRVNLDFHAVPGRQNGFNHSSKQGNIGFLNGVMGWANYQRTMNYIRTLAEFISTPQYTNVVGIFSILNEPVSSTIGLTNLQSFYLEAYNQVRNITGIGQGPYIAFGDMAGASQWTGFLAGADRIIMDNHPYLIFGQPNTTPLSGLAGDVCSGFGAEFSAAKVNFGIYIAGEWSLANTDCGLFLNNVGNGNRYDGTYYNLGSGNQAFGAVGDCAPWNNYDQWSATVKQGYSNLARANMDAYGDYFFWTWKTGFSQQLGKIANPAWNYQLGLASGWISADPRAAIGSCSTFATPPSPAPPAPTYTPGTGTIAPAQIALYGRWPPTSIGDPALAVAGLPSLVPTGTIKTMSAGPTPTLFPIGYGNTKVNVGSGWKDSADTKGWYVEKQGCAAGTYLDAWSGVGANVPPVC